MEEQLSGSWKKIWKDIRRILISHREKELFHMNSLEYLKEEMRTKLDHIVSIKQLQTCQYIDRRFKKPNLV